MFIKGEAVVRACGNYVAFHEMMLDEEWLFGDLFYCEDLIGDYLCGELNVDWEELEKQDKATMDTLVRKYVEEKEQEQDYCDIGIVPCVAEADSNGTVSAVWW